MLTRRQLISVGGLAALGLSLPKLLRTETRGAESKADGQASSSQPVAAGGKAKSCILFFMEGGPSHIDLWDMKPEAPEQVRGIYKPISTSVPGLQICEKLSSWSPLMHHLAVIRSVRHKVVDHNASSYYTLTGQYPFRGGELIRRPSRDNFPPIGSVLARLHPTDQPLPDFIHIPKRMFNCGSFIPAQLGGFFGESYDPFITGDPSVQDYRVPGLEPLSGLNQQRLDDRRRLLSEVRGLTEGSGAAAGDQLDEYIQKAYSLVTSQKARQAFRLQDEPESILARYGADENNGMKGKSLTHLGASLLLARRLVESGVRLVTVWAGHQAFDTHKKHYDRMNSQLCPFMDIAFSALIEDLAQRGMLDETLVVAMGEFGRTPKLGQVTSSAGATPEGRDHWPQCYTVMLAGGGIQPGAVYGASDRLAAYPERDPVTPADVCATIYTALGIDPKTRIFDALNRPHTLVNGHPIQALL